jgi:hypothetical protein
MRLVLAVAATLVLGVPGGAECGGVQLFGEPLTGLEPTPLAEVLADPEEGKQVCLEGTVAAVCQTKGCWLELKQGDASVHVTFEGYSFFVPKDSKGRAVRLEGRVLVKQPKPEVVAHLRAEGASEAAGKRVTIMASGVELR